jgi:ubiquinone/menaquinone biosynthesis C-methylase UbiE
MAQNDFDKEMKDADWIKVFARQAMRAPLLEQWFDDLELEPGSRVADLGCGPGYVAMRVAMRVGAAGCVYAIDRSAEALETLDRIRDTNALAQIRTDEADIAALSRLPGPVDAVIAAMMLHHNDHPAALLGRIAELAGPGQPILVAEFHPHGPAEVGPPADVRIGPEELRAAASEAGLTERLYRRQTPEHYLMVMAR